MSGKRVSKPSELNFLLDEALAPTVATALGAVGYDVSTLEKGIQDPAIIAWCKENDAVWLHADDRAKKEHRKLLQTSGIYTIWIYRTKGLMTGKEQLRILAFVLPIFIRELEHRPGKRHYQAKATDPWSKPSLRLVDL